GQGLTKGTVVLRFIARRLGISLLILFLGSILMYVLTINSGDPLEDLRGNNSSNADQLIQARVDRMNLDEPWYVRYGLWLGGASKCFVLSCDLGDNRSGTSVNTLVTAAASSSLRLVTLATVIAIVLGVAAGVLSAIRQYSGFDYAVTFAAFLFFSLPVFWAAVLLKQYGAIDFNNWMADPGISLITTIILALIFGGAASVIAGGDKQRRLITFAATAIGLALVLIYFNAVNWFAQPALGLPLIILLSLAALGLLLMLTVGLRNRQVINCGLITIAVGIVSFFITRGMMEDPSWTLLAILAAISVAVGAVVGVVAGGYERATAITISIGTALSFGFFVFLDRLLSNWASYVDITGRPISTIGSGSPLFSGNFYEGTWDWVTQLILPSTVLILISLASYSRYTRSSMLETTQQDYMRTAKSKGLSDRVINTKHALRNALIPITTIVAFDFASLISGAVVTETVFGWSGMGALFKVGLDNTDPNPLMGFFLVTGTAAVLMNMLADIAYASLDPRIRR
ncbi:MAG: ABC transporter permease, partial [Ornithinimicrobium sp.]